MKIKEHASLIIGFSIPVIMILFVAGSIYLPGLFGQQPTTNFLYLSGDEYYYGGGQQYSVQNGKLTKAEMPAPAKGDYIPPVNAAPKFFVYDALKNESREVSFEDAQKLRLDTNLVSPDGFEVVQGRGGGGFFPFFYDGGNYDARYLKGHGISKKINLQPSGPYYYNFRFLGWIK